MSDTGAASVNNTPAAAGAKTGISGGDQFGGLRGRSPGGGGVSGNGIPDAPASVVDDTIYGGAANSSNGLVRAPRRVVKAKGGLSSIVGVKKSYRTTAAIMFNNLDEMFQDVISRDFAQEIIERTFDVWGIPMDQPEAVKYAEDLIIAFLVAVTASNKADYNRSFFVPVLPGTGSDDGSEAVANFAQFSDLLAGQFGVTRRQFARAIADDQRAYVTNKENQHLIPVLATRAACDPQLAHLAFDGSTHCSGMTSRETSFTKTLENRNLFEREDVLAQGASDRLMQGVSGGVRSTAPR